MGEKARELAGADVERIIGELNKAYADEWLAFYQYWVTSKVLEGRYAGRVTSELSRLATEELEHADELAERIVQLGGRPLASPKQWTEQSTCGYKEPPRDAKDLDKVIRDTIDGERCAISVYRKLMDMTRDSDYVTFQLIQHILEEELEHEDTFENLL